MKVLYITTVPSPYKVDMFEELGKMCDLTVIFENQGVSYRDKSWMVTEYRNFKAEFLKGIKIKNTILSTGIIKNLKKNRYDIIVIGVYSTISQMIAQLYMKKHNINYVISSDGGMIKSEKKIFYKIKKYFIKNANAWLSTAIETTKYLEYYGANKKKIFNYPFTSIKDDDIIRRKLSNEEKKVIKSTLGIKEKKIVISVGQFIYRKGYDILINSCKDFDNDIGIYIIGGKITEEYKKIIKKSKFKNFYFLDFMNKKELSNYYKIADLFVLPTREDIWGLVINEAMAYGLPVITTNKCVAGLELIKDGKNGYIVESDNEVKLREKITFLLANENLRTNMSNANISSIKQYTIRNMAKRHIEIFNILV